MLEPFKPSIFVLHKIEISGKFASKKNWQPTNLGPIPWILVKLSFKELSDSKLSCLRTFTTQPFASNIRQKPEK